MGHSFYVIYINELDFLVNEFLTICAGNTDD